jgi:hypothetical protein
MAHGGIGSVAPIRPRPLDVNAIRSGILREKEKKGQEGRRKLEATTRTWRGARPRFYSAVSLSNGDLFIGARKGGEGYEKWVRLQWGTRRHPIRARRKPRLAFRWPGFLPKTTPRHLGAGPGRQATGPWRRPLAVMHPGTKPRRWLETLQEWLDTRTNRDRMQQALIRSMRRR